MRLVTYVSDGKERVGVISKDDTYVYPIRSAELDYVDMNELIKGISKAEMERLSALAAKKGTRAEDVLGAVPMDEVVLKAPIPRPKQDIICLGINYMAHAEESARYKKEAFDRDRACAIYFSKRVNEAVATGEPILSHEDMVDSLDYECELAVVIGKDARNVAKEDAEEYIFGYTIINDVSARNVQTQHKQWYFGKSLDGFTPMGPCITTRNDIAFPPKLKIQSKVNGELRQDSNTGLLIFDVAHVICELSQGMSLKTGTIIAMGTPAGVGMGFTPPKFLKPGDTVECIVEGIGSLKNVVK